MAPIIEACGGTFDPVFRRVRLIAEIEAGSELIAVWRNNHLAAIARLRNSLEAGGIAVLARMTATGEPVGAGVCSIPSNQTTEIAGIGVHAAFRRRGVAGALTTRLVQEAFAAGISVPFLMAAHEAEKRIYERAGFSVVGEILRISCPRT